MSLDPINFKKSDSYNDMKDAIITLTTHVNSLTLNQITLLRANASPSFTVSLTNTKTAIPDVRELL